MLRQLGIVGQLQLVPWHHQWDRHRDRRPHRLLPRRHRCRSLSIRDASSAPVCRPGVRPGQLRQLQPPPQPRHLGRLRVLRKHDLWRRIPRRPPCGDDGIGCQPGIRRHDSLRQAGHRACVDQRERPSVLLPGAEFLRRAVPGGHPLQRCRRAASVCPGRHELLPSVADAAGLLPHRPARRAVDGLPRLLHRVRVCHQPVRRRAADSAP